MFLNLQRISAAKLSEARTRALEEAPPAPTLPTVDIPGVGETTLTAAAAVSYYNALNPKEQDQERRRYDTAEKAEELPEGVDTFTQWLEWRAKSAATKITIGERREIEVMKDKVGAVDYFKGDKFRLKAEDEAGGVIGTYGMDPEEKSRTVAAWMDAQIKARFPDAVVKADGWYLSDGTLIRAWTE